MKFLIIGDTHFKMTGQNRSDDVHATQMQKFRLALAIGATANVSGVIQVGDLFNHPDVPYELTSDLLELCREASFPGPIFTVLGQHDRYMRTGIKRSPTRVMQEAGHALVLSSTSGAKRSGKFYDSDDAQTVTVYGAGHGEDPPTPDEPVNAKHTNVLIVHAMIHPKPKFPGDTEFDTPRNYLAKYNEFDAVFCGDYHGRFEYRPRKNGRRVIANPGALFRQTILDKDTAPGVFVWDSVDGSLEFHPIDHIEDPFIQREGSVEKSEQLSQMITKLHEGQGATVSFGDVLKQKMKKKRTPKRVRDRVWGAVEDAQSQRREEAK